MVDNQIPMRVIIVGTSHGYQVLDSSRPTAQGAKQFQAEMCKLCAEKGIAGVAEEMSDYAMEYRKGEECAGRFAARSLDLPHIMCDLDENERAALGIKDPATMCAIAFLKGEPDPSPQQIREKNYDPREKIWLRRVLDFEKWPCLFICGSDHVESFSSKLVSVGIEVEVWNRDWSPA